MNDDLATSRGRRSSRCKPYQHAAWEPALERLHANEMPWRATGDRHGGRAESLSGAATACAASSALAALYGAQPEPDARRSRQRRSDRPAGARVLPRRAGPGRHLPADIRHVRGRRAHPGRACVEVPLARRRLRSRCGGSASRRDAGRQDGIPVLAEQSDRQRCSTEDAILRRAARASPASALIVVDEAYIEFSDGRVSRRALAEHPEPRRAAHLVEGACAGRRALRRADRHPRRSSAAARSHAAVCAARARQWRRCCGSRRSRSADRRRRASHAMRAERERMRARWRHCLACAASCHRDANFLLVRFRDAEAALAAGCSAAACAARHARAAAARRAACASRSARRSRTSGCSSALERA